jgi:CheY-like chemotaxis protein
MHKPSPPFTALITDDMEPNRLYMTDLILSIIPSAVIDVAMDGAEAVSKVSDKIEQTCSSYNLIIMDYQMPVLDGATATSQIKRLEKQQQVRVQSLIITWSTSKSKPYKDADDWLPKQAAKQDLLSLLRIHGLIS